MLFRKFRDYQSLIYDRRLASHSRKGTSVTNDISDGSAPLIVPMNHVCMTAGTKEGSPKCHLTVVNRYINYMCFYNSD